MSLRRDLKRFQSGSLVHDAPESRLKCRPLHQHPLTAALPCGDRLSGCAAPLKVCNPAIAVPGAECLVKICALVPDCYVPNLVNLNISLPARYIALGYLN